MTVVVIHKVENKVDHARSVQVRTLVFVSGQNVPPEREIDEHEEDSHYFIAILNGRAIGTARWRMKNEDTAKIERLAVLDEMRGKGIGRKLMLHLMEDIKKNSVASKIKMGSQDHAIPFYESMGFKVMGEGYMDGGTIPHHDMVMTLER